MSTLVLLGSMLLPLAIAFGGGYLLGKSDLIADLDDARWNAFDTALDAATDEAWDVYYAAYPREAE